MTSVGDSEKGIAPVFMILLLGSLTIGGSALVAASGTTKPGDLIYPIKQASEATQLSFTFSPDSQLELRLKLSQNRLDEIKRLLSVKNADDPLVNAAIDDLIFQNQKAASRVTNQSLQGQSVQDKARDVLSLLDSRDEQFKAILAEVKSKLLRQKSQLRTNLTFVIPLKDSEKISQITSQLDAAEQQLDDLDLKSELYSNRSQVLERPLEDELDAEEQRIRREASLDEIKRNKLEEYQTKAEDLKNLEEENKYLLQKNPAELSVTENKALELINYEKAHLESELNQKEEELRAL